MGEHKGYRATKNPNGTWKSWALDKASGGYVKRSPFPTESAAKADGKARHERLSLRLEFAGKAPARSMADDYLRHLEHVRKRTPSHLANVRRALAIMCSAVPDLSHSGAVEALEERLAGLPVAARTKVQYLDVAKSLCNWLVARRKLAYSPLEVAETEEPGDFLKEQFTVPELRAMVTAWGDPFHLTACAMIYLGLRISEPCGTTWAALDHSEDFARIYGKGNKERLVRKMPEFKAILSLYRPPPGSSALALPLCSFKRWTAYRHFRAFLFRLRIPYGARTPHSTRHSFAGLMTASHVSSSLLADQMAHSSQGTTREYSRLATVYTSDVQGWPVGEFQLLVGASSPLPARQSAVA